MAASGWFTSCAIDVFISPSVVTRVTWASAVCAVCNASCICSADRAVDLLLNELAIIGMSALQYQPEGRPDRFIKSHDPKGLFRPDVVSNPVPADYFSRLVAMVERGAAYSARAHETSGAGCVGLNAIFRRRFGHE